MSTTTMTDSQLSPSGLLALRKRHTRVDPGPCPVCGGERELVGRDHDNLVYACYVTTTTAGATEEHYHKSRISLYQPHDPDPRVLKLIDAYSEAKELISDLLDFAEIQAMNFCEETRKGGIPSPLACSCAPCRARMVLGRIEGVKPT